ncbi:MAG: 2-oxoacid:ferredoxin oxidoreductase subunit alpha [Nitrososphaeraceae archaeon]
MEHKIEEVSWVIGGAQGSGVDSAANIFSRTCAEAGLYVFGKREYYSNIKGEHSYFTVRISNKPIRSHKENIDILISFDAETIFRHAMQVSQDGIIICNSESINTSLNEIPTIDEEIHRRITKEFDDNGNEVTVQKILDNVKKKSVTCYDIPFLKLLKNFSEEIGNPALSKLARMINVMAISISLAMLGFDKQKLFNAINYTFHTKPKIAETNIAAAEYSYKYANQLAKNNKIRFNGNKESFSDIILVQGSQASAMGKIIAGCRFQTYYPITPASEDSEFLELNEIIEQSDGKKGSILVMQTEDEIAAITMAIGGALTGARTSTATSGPGFSLMAEALGWAGINEVPLVISLYQRAGPSTGLPTRHEQGDLLFAINAGHGEFPKIVFASGDIEESFYDTIRVFNFAEIFQLPVIHLLDKAIASSIMTFKKFDASKIDIDRGSLIEKSDNLLSSTSGNFKRFELTDDNISNRVALGTEHGIFWNTGDEHNEEGHITEDPEMRIKMMNKRMRKLELISEKISNEDKVKIFYESSEIIITSWGSTKGVILDTLDLLREEGFKIRFIQVKLLNPFPKILLEKLLNNVKTIINVEMNYSSQLAQIIKQNLNKDIDYEIVKYNGRPISLDELYITLKKILNNSINNKRVVLDYGV